MRDSEILEHIDRRFEEHRDFFADQLRPVVELNKDNARRLAKIEQGILVWKGVRHGAGLVVAVLAAVVTFHWTEAAQLVHRISGTILGKPTE